MQCITIIIIINMICEILRWRHCAVLVEFSVKMKKMIGNWCENFGRGENVCMSAHYVQNVVPQKMCR
jgi:hypothetical protein